MFSLSYNHISRGVYITVMCLCSLSSLAASSCGEKDSTYVYDGIAGILDEVVVTGYRETVSTEDSLRLRRRIFKVWHYAALGADYLQEMDMIRQESSRREFRHTVQNRQKELFAEFEDILKKFSRSEGRVLIKLVHRLTGISVYDIARDLKSGWRAWWWNSAAGMFSLSLKAEYHPRSVAEDRVMENILLDYFDKGMLMYYPAHWEGTSYFYAPARRTSEEMQKAEERAAAKRMKKYERQGKK